jgi:hypothetical protein
MLGRTASLGSKPRADTCMHTSYESGAQPSGLQPGRKASYQLGYLGTVIYICMHIAPPQIATFTQPSSGHMVTF